METKQNSGPKINKGEKTGIAGILSALGWNAAEGEAVSGGLGGLIDAATSGGILATKAGVVALALAGTTIAGGVGWLGYKVLGPGPGDKAHSHFQVFQPKPASSNSGAAQGGNGGKSQGSGQSSLGELSQANQGAMGQAAALASAAPVASAAIGAAPKSPNLGKAFGGKGPKIMPKLAGASKIGQLSNLNAKGAAAPAKKAAPVHALAASGLPGGVGSGAPHGALAGRGFGSGGGGGGGFRAMNGAGTGYGSMGPNNVPGNGLFDGSRASSLGVPSGSGVGGAGSGAPTQFPNASSYGGQYSPQGGNNMNNGMNNGTNVTPWQGAINLATMLSLLAAGLMFAAYKVSTASPASLSPATARIILGVLGAVIMAIGGFIADLGHQMGSAGTYGQSFQGGAFLMAGVFIGIAGAAIAAGGIFNEVGSGSTAGSTLTTIFMLSGAVGLLSAMTGYLTPGQQWPATMFYGNPPDWTNPNAQVNPNPYAYPSYGGYGGYGGYQGGGMGGL